MSLVPLVLPFLPLVLPLPISLFFHSPYFSLCFPTELRPRAPACPRLLPPFAIPSRVSDKIPVAIASSSRFALAPSSSFSSLAAGRWQKRGSGSGESDRSAVARLSHAVRLLMRRISLNVSFEDAAGEEPGTRALLKPQVLLPQLLPPNLARQASGADQTEIVRRGSGQEADGRGGKGWSTVNSSYQEQLCSTIALDVTFVYSFKSASCRRTYWRDTLSFYSSSSSLSSNPQLDSISPSSPQLPRPCLFSFFYVFRSREWGWKWKLCC
eukprot:238332-Hanusia_phi.AAC.3